MNRVYVITQFDLKTDVPMKYALKYRDLYYNKKDLVSDIKYILNTINEEYQEITNTNISYSDFYNKFNLIIEVSVINLNYNRIETRKDYENKLKELDKISKDNLEEFLLSFLVSYRFYYDKDFNITEINTNTEYDFYGSDIYPDQFSFSYKALHPEKYHVEKYNNGDRVIYKGEEYTIFEKMNKSIFESDNPLNFAYGYTLIDDHGKIIQDDKFYYFPVDEDLEFAKSQYKIQKITKDLIDDFKFYIYIKYYDNIVIENLTDDFYNMEYNKMIRADNDISIILNYDSKNIVLSDQWSYIFFMNKNPIAYILGNIEIENCNNLKNIQIKYKNHIIDEIDLTNILKSKSGDIVLNISKYLDGPEVSIIKD